ncbi:unnamed protein product [Acanthosepion pharaonis]|uniref:Reverse transcriptase domain-containing protein n=1 Tax=Acanthosepion pharaonis TaxID=158019 RepID=A0A812BLH6_ACAPH|nr:unnamed protein product [Sepia pharaonis]
MGKLCTCLSSLSGCRYEQCAWIGSYTCPRKPPSATAGKEIHQDPEANQCRQSEAARGRTVRNRFSLRQPSSEPQPEIEWQPLKSATVEAAHAHLGVTRHPYRDWITGESFRLVKKARVARLTGAANFRDLRRRATRSIRADRNAHWCAFAEETERAAACGDSRKLYQMVRRASRGSLGEGLNRWKEHFDELLNHPTPATDVAVEPTDEYDCNAAPPTVDEVRDILRHLRNNKAPGENGIPAEVYKAVPDVFPLWVHRVFNAVWLSETYLADWSEAILLPLFKNGDRRLCSNYRGISLIDMVAKVLAVLLLGRFQGIRDLRTRRSQGGFRPGRGCVDQIFSLRRTLEQRWAYQQPTVLFFVDYAAAFDSVDRGSLWRIMEADGMPAKLLRLIKSYYRSTRARLCAYGEESETFEVKTGVRQGCALSPTLFNYTIDYILGKAHLDYAGVAAFFNKNDIANLGGPR